MRVAARRGGGRIAPARVLSCRVLYVNHTSVVGGGELSLLELLSAEPLRAGAALAVPPGALADQSRARGLPVWQTDGFSYGLGVSGSGYAHASLGFLRAVRSLRHAIVRLAPQVVHANSLRAGLLAVAATGGSGPPVVVHVRDCLPQARLARIVRGVVLRRAAVVLANSRHTLGRFLGDTSTAIACDVAYPSIDLRRFDPSGHSRPDARTRLGLAQSSAVMGVVGQLTEWKGQLDAIRALALVKPLVPAARLVIAGSVKFRSTRYDNATYAETLRREAERLHVREAVSFLGERSDVAEVLRALDVLLVPSWDEPLGRVVLEGMAMGLPVVATHVGGPRELIEDGVDGLLLPPRAPARWAEAVSRLFLDRERADELGSAGRAKALRGFDVANPVEVVLRAHRTAREARDCRSRRTAASSESSA